MRVVAIAKALQNRGHDIQFIAAGKLIPIIKEFGIDVIEVNDMPQFEIPADQAGKDAMMTKLPDILGKLVEIETEVAKKAKPNLILSGTLSGARVAQQLGIPVMSIFLQPHGMKTVTMIADRIAGNAEKMRGIMTDILGSATAIVLEGMPEIGGEINFEDFAQELATIKNKVYFSGPLLTQYPSTLATRDELKTLHIGDQHKTMVYITIGGGSALIGEQFLKTALDALKMMPDIVGVIATGMAFPVEVLNKYEPPSNAIVRGFVPGTEMIKASDVTIFHGGSSTLMTCIACGTPAVVVPSIGEQEDNGAVLEQYGAGIVLNKKMLTPKILANAIYKILSDPTYREKAEELRTLGEKYGGADAMASLAEKIAVQEAGLR